MMKYSVLEVHLIVAVLLATTPLYATTTGGKKKNDQRHQISPIVKVLNTTKKLWLYWKNYTDEVDWSGESLDESLPFNITQKCTFMKMYNITDAEIHYWWKTIINSEMVESHIYGQFFQEKGENFGSMNITDISGNETIPSSTMTLKYEGEKCYVFFVTSLREDDEAEAECELYVRGKPNPSNPSQDCKDYYEKHCINKTVVYESDCKSQVKKAEAALKKIMN
uniref:Lipocalin n=1 Tax=Rhipicephalus appendiculatus TaxID=34631 RepID=A0A131Z5Q8_RHIAP